MPGGPVTSDLQLICLHPPELCAWTAHARVRGRVTLAVPLPVCKEGIYWPTHRVLGIQWNTSNDTLCIEPTLPEKPATRRGILSSLSSLYDPLGFLSPCTLVAKNLLKKLCTDKYDWDDPVPDEILSEWIRWKTEATQLSELRIPRCYFSTNHGPVKKYELHHFSDASYDGCGQCSYLRAAYEDGHITSSLVMSKTKVTPLKSVTIPRLELVAALMSVRVSCFLRSELTIKEFDEFFWTDSTAVLGYVKNDTKRFHVYVANRVQEIRQSTNPEQWLYIESKMNPADLASRGATVAELIESSLWWHGPPFLTAKQSLPVTEQQFSVADEDPEVKHSTFQTAASQKPEAKEKKKTMMKEVNELYASSEEDENLTPVTPQDESHKVTGERSKDEQDAAQAPMPDLPRRMTYFSNWHRAKKSVALCIRYKHVQVPAGVMRLTTVNGQNRAAFVDNKRNMRKCNCHASVTQIGSILSLVMILRITTKSQSSKNKSSARLRAPRLPEPTVAAKPLETLIFHDIF